VEVRFCETVIPLSQLVYLGILVVGAERVEKEIGRLKKSLRIVTVERTDTTIKHSYEKLRDDIGHHLTAKTREFDIIQKSLRQKTRVRLDETGFRANNVLRRIIKSIIHELEKLDHGLGQGRGYAA
jgi:hypothetical protein